MWEGYGRLTMFLVMLIYKCYGARSISVVHGSFSKKNQVSTIFLKFPQFFEVSTIFLKQKEKPEYRFFCFGEISKKKRFKKKFIFKRSSKNKIFFKQSETLVDVVTFTSSGCLKGRMVLFKKKICGKRKLRKPKTVETVGTVETVETTTTKKLQGL
jgi:hypothetical protein